jgi:ATP-dependent helicase YprA (DUF1998 family)
MSLTIQETIHQLHGCLRDYIEATYHIGSPSLIAQRRELLARVGVIHQAPYIESTPRYQSGTRFSAIKGLPEAALTAFERLSRADGSLPALFYDPPYKHQSDAVRYALVERKNLLVMTGTGSGKTESFLLPILGKLAREAQAKPMEFRDRAAVRALILYPMNALVNDQLGRLRSIFGDARTVGLFKGWAGRPARFARYTSRTPYAGIRTREKDSRKLKAFDEFYVEIQRLAQSAPSEEQVQAFKLLRQLKERGKWPAKPDLIAWFGNKGSDWQDRRTLQFRRAIMLPDDVELITRHEVQASPPDLLVTNYSMLEYMLMRPVERTIFDRTSEWLRENPGESFLIVLDEAHLYRGAAGAEVGLLLRRLRDRLGIPPERFQVICATASFTDAKYAPKFGAQLTGVPANTFVAITGEYAWREHAADGTLKDSDALAAVDLEKFYATDAESERLAIVAPLLKHRGVPASGRLEADLYTALKDFPPLGQLINSTMTQARPVQELGKALFPHASQSTADTAVTVLMALASMARLDPLGASLLPCRIHNFFRGLPGLWVCMDPKCTALSAHEHNGICGKMYSQPREQCECKARVLEFYTCRHCGTAYARAYTDDPDAPNALWPEPGRRIRLDDVETRPLLSLDLLLEPPHPDRVPELADYDLETGRLNPNEHGQRMRTVYLRAHRDQSAVDEDGEVNRTYDVRGQFAPCACCGKMASFARSSVQDHQTKGDQPFQALVTKQIQIQPPGAVKASRFAPLRGRKVLVFSDSRQVAARLAPNLQMYSTRDSLRPLIAWGFRRLQEVPSYAPLLNLDDLYLAIMLASKKLHVRLRPELKASENFAAEDTVELAVQEGAADTDAGLQFLMTKMRSETPPQSLLEDIVTTVQDPFLGLEALAIASLCERSELTSRLSKLPTIPGVAETNEAKIALARAWLRCWRNLGFWLAKMPTTWWNRPRSQGVSVKAKKGKGKFKAMDIIVKAKPARKIFHDKWTPELLEIFTTDVNGEHQLRGSELSLLFDGQWIACSTCRSVHRPVPGLGHCLDCGSEDIRVLDPDADAVFLARRGYYRRPVMAALAQPPSEPMALIAAEHTAQLNAPQNEDVFSKAEENELLFQDLSPVLGRKAHRATAIDVLSSTTTMEVGIDIGALSGVSLRNMPPGRANYQQRAGRAGRRGNAVATVIAFGSADSHDEHYFTAPGEMIRGDVIDPRLTLDNREIVRRHIRAFLLQNYHQDRIPIVDPAQPHDLFSVLGTVTAFRSGKALLNMHDFAIWITKNEHELQKRISAWIPAELSAQDRSSLLDEMKADAVKTLEDAIRADPKEDAVPSTAAVNDPDSDSSEDVPEEGEENPGQKGDTRQLLDRLLYRGVLPRYAFPTDVATFHVFDQARSSKFRPVMRFAPSQGLPIALTQYAPGKQIWIAGKCYVSGAVYSVMAAERDAAWESKRLYSECSTCGFAKTYAIGEIDRGTKQDCPACGSKGTFGEARYWLRPPGFAHAIDVEEVTSPDDMPETSYATRAKLTMNTPPDAEKWTRVNDRTRVLRERKHLLVSNAGPKRDGYSYCVKCGRIEASSNPTPLLSAPHRKPFPDDKEPMCPGQGTTRHMVLGTDFITDIALFSMKVIPPVQLRPGQYPTDVALRTVSEALAKAGSKLLGIEPSELMAEFRPALTPEGQRGLESEIFVYDTLPGGAGFSAQLVGRGQELFELALSLIEKCPEGCDASCYRCLRSFKNKFEHRLLDRHVGAELLRYLLTGVLPHFDAGRVKASTTLLANDLQRQGGLKIHYEDNMLTPGKRESVGPAIVATRTDGKQFLIALTGPLTPEVAADPGMRDYAQGTVKMPLILVNELLVRGNLPAATHEAQVRIGDSG